MLIIIFWWVVEAINLNKKSSFKPMGSLVRMWRSGFLQKGVNLIAVYFLERKKFYKGRRLGSIWSYNNLPISIGSNIYKNHSGCEVFRCNGKAES